MNDVYVYPVRSTGFWLAGFWQLLQWIALWPHVACLRRVTVYEWTWEYYNNSVYFADYKKLYAIRSLHHLGDDEQGPLLVPFPIIDGFLPQPCTLWIMFISNNQAAEKSNQIVIIAQNYAAHDWPDWSLEGDAAISASREEWSGGIAPGGEIRFSAFVCVMVYDDVEAPNLETIPRF